MSLLVGLAAYFHQEKKPSLNLENREKVASFTCLGKPETQVIEFKRGCVVATIAQSYDDMRIVVSTMDDERIVS